MTRTMTLNQFSGFVAALDEKTERAAIRGFQRAGLVLQRQVVVQIGRAAPSPPVDTGELRNSVTYTMHSDGSTVSVDAPHAAVMENGRRPGARMPPVQAIADWMARTGAGGSLINVARKSIAQEAIGLVGRSAAIASFRANKADLEEAARWRAALMMARSIAKKGIKPRHYFRDAWDQAAGVMANTITYEIAKVGWVPTAAERQAVQKLLSVE